MLDFTPIMYVKLADSTLGIEKAIVASHFPHFLIFFILSMKNIFLEFFPDFLMKLPVSRRLYLRVDRVSDFGIYHNRSNIGKIPTISWKIGSPSPSNWSDIPVIRYHHHIGPKLSRWISKLHFEPQPLGLERKGLQ